MKKYMMLILIFSSFLVISSCNEKQNQAQAADCENSDCSESTELSEGCAGCPQTDSEKIVLNQQKESNEKPLITFVELGSVNCIPCKKMQPVMKAIEEKYAGQVEVIFYDVWKPDQKKYAQEYGIRLIPTQVFLDRDDKEIMRHEGFFPETEIDRFLRKQGLTPKEEG
jgi:thioredoxin 1